jgi:hypothetical protein
LLDVFAAVATGQASQTEESNGWAWCSLDQRLF